MANAQIEDQEFTLFYDYDQLRDRKLTQLTDDGQVEWFRLRMECVFLEPLRRIFDRESVAHRELNSSPEDDGPSRTVMIAAFSILLNGIEALGSFLTSTRTSNRDNFYAFITNYMRNWDTIVSGTSYQTDCLPEILWKHFRNGVAHGFVIEGGGIDYEADETRWLVRDRCLEIGPERFFDEFQTGVGAFIDDISNPKSNRRTRFMSRFREVYPC